MASYSKRMIEIAKRWLTANPDPDSEFLVIPGLHSRFERDALRDQHVRDIERIEAKAAKVTDPAKAAEAKKAVEVLRAELARRDGVIADLHKAERELEQLVNTVPKQHHGKYDVDDNYRVDVGRWCLAWARHGYNVFDLSADFTAAMLLTDARELDIESVRLPFCGLLFLVPDGFARGVEGSSYTRIHVTEIPRAKLAMMQVANDVADVLKDLPERDARDVLTEARERVAAKPIQTLVERIVDPNDTALHVYASDGVRVLDTFIERKGLTWESFDALPDNVVEDADRDARRTIRQIVFGTLAYVTAVPTAMESMLPPGPPRARREPREETTRWTIERTLKLDPNLVKSVRGGSREIAFRLKHRHIVRGHYRNQVHGVGRAERKRIWVQPFWRGPEDGAALVHTYKLEEKQ